MKNNRRLPSFTAKPDSVDFLLPTLASIYLLLTVILFLAGPYPALLQNLNVLLMFLILVGIAFWVGYHARVASPRSPRPDEIQNVPSRVARLAFVASAAWFIVFSVASMAEYGAVSPADVIAAIANPGDSYFAKFDTYLEQNLTGRTNPVLQLSVLTSVLSTVLVPLLVFYWNSWNTVYRVLGVAAVGSYITYFLYIGTQKGVGDIVVMSAVALIARYAVESQDPAILRIKLKKLMLVAVVVGLGFLSYVAVNQAERISGTTIEANFAPNPIISDIFGESFARGVSVASFYPSHGYYGLALNLEAPFVWAEGLGSAPALASYKVQYLGGTNPTELSYPARTEVLTGWPAGQYWSTIFPWLASDFSFPGVIVIVLLFGVACAHLWERTRRRGDYLALIVLAQFAIAIAYVPANNQLMVTRTAALGLISLVILYAARPLLRALQRSRSVQQSEIKARTSSRSGPG